MHTLHDFMMFTKGNEYLIAIGAMALFGLFWFILGRGSRNKGN